MEMIAAMNPDIEVVDRDAGNGKVTIRNKQTGETVTVDLDDIKPGQDQLPVRATARATLNLDQQTGTMKIQGEGDDGGTLSFGGDTAPAQLGPSYPGATSEGVYNAETAGAESAARSRPPPPTASTRCFAY